MQKNRYLFFIFTLAIAFFCGYAANAQTSDDDLSMQRMTDRVNAMEKNLATMQQELYRSGKSVSHTPSDVPAGDEDEKTRVLNGKFEEINHRIDTLSEKIDKMQSDTDFRINAVEKALAEKAAAPAAKVEPSADADAKAEQEKTADDTLSPLAEEDTSASAEPQEEEKALTPADKYKKAVELVRTSKYAEAEKAFKDFIANNKGSKLIGNSYYWLGETYFSRENYQQAAVNFLKVYKEFPKGTKAPDSLYKLGMSLKKLKKEKEACASWRKQKKEYPNMEKDLLAKTDSEIKALKCK